MSARVGAVNKCFIKIVFGALFFCMVLNAMGAEARKDTVIGRALGQVREAVNKLWPFARRTVFREDFEGASNNCPRIWATNSKDYKIKFEGINEERAFSGKKSFKLDILLDGGSYFYYAIPVRIPFKNPVSGESAKLRFSVKMLIARADGMDRNKNRIELGYGWDDPEIGATGSVTKACCLKEEENGWLSWQADAKAMRSDTAGMEWLAVYIVYNRDGFKKTRVIIYLDDFEVKGDLPADYGEKYGQLLETQRNRWLNLIRDYHKEISFKYKNKPAAGDGLSGWKLEQFNRLDAYAGDKMREVDSEMTGLNNGENIGWLRYKALKAKLKSTELALNSCRGILECSNFFAHAPYVIYEVQATMNDRILPDLFPIPGVICQKLKVAACRGEYEPVSFVMQSPVVLEEVMVEASDLCSEDGKNRLPSSIVDIRTVKVWWQSGKSYYDSSHPCLAPELLLKDDNFVTVDYGDVQKHSNILKNPNAPQDADMLQPVNVPAGTAKQFWITVHIPGDAKAGIYSGYLTVRGKGLNTLKVPLSVQVYPFKLAETDKEYMAYYTTALSLQKPDPVAVIVSEDIYRAELKNILEHGIKTTVMYCGFPAPDKDGNIDFSLLKKELDIRMQLGLTGGPIPIYGETPLCSLFWTAEPVAADEKAKKIELARNVVKQANKFCDENKYPRLAFGGIDEITTRGMQWAQERIWALKAVKEAGGYTFSAEAPDYFDIAGDYLTHVVLALHSGSVSSELVADIHKRGFKAFEYGRPQGCAEEPDTFRRGYGILIWKDNLDGASHWAWQHIKYRDYRAYDDFVSYGEPARKFVMAYPTVNGVIDTVQWEGLREGIDDMRYIQTLEKLLEKPAANEKKRKAQIAAKNFLSTLDVDGDLDVIRSRISRFIMEINNN